MKLHESQSEFRELIILTALEKHISESAVERDYYIVRALQYLADSDEKDSCVFKGGTSLSKCYPGSIERFSEDIDLTFYKTEGLSNKQIERRLKTVEKIMTVGAKTEPIASERNDRNKSSYFWFDSEDSRIKLEIGSSVRPEPFNKKVLVTYIQEYLEEHGFENEAAEYGLVPVELNVLNIERTFLDKIMAVKRHAICGTLSGKVRHIYDVTRLFSMPENQEFLQNKKELKNLIGLTKETDTVYLEKRNISENYNPSGAYDFFSWKDCFNDDIRSIYEHLHEDLLYTDEKQNFDVAIQTFEKISTLFAEIGE